MNVNKIVVVWVLLIVGLYVEISKSYISVQKRSYFNLNDINDVWTHLNERLNYAVRKSSNITRKDLGFSWSNCGGNQDIVKVKKLAIGPDPLQLPGTVSLAFDVVVGSNLTSMSADVEVKKKVLGIPVKIPCEDGVGSCSYSNICSLLPPGPCPKPFVKRGIPCQCPIKQGKYSLPTTKIKVKLPDNVPHFLEEGDYEVELRLTAALKNKTAPVACIKAAFSLG